MRRRALLHFGCRLLFLFNVTKESIKSKNKWQSQWQICSLHQDPFASNLETAEKHMRQASLLPDVFQISTEKRHFYSPGSDYSLCWSVTLTYPPVESDLAVIDWCFLHGINIFKEPNCEYRTRTYTSRNQKPVPYHLANSQLKHPQGMQA